MWEIKCFNWVEKEHYIFGTCIDKNAIVRIDKKSKKADVIGQFPEYSMDAEYLSWGCASFENNIWFIPFNANHIAVYDGKSMEYIGLPPATPCNIQHNINQKFLTAIEYDEYVFLPGFYYPGIVRINKKTYEVVLIDDWIEDVKTLLNQSIPEMFFGEGIFMVDRKIYIPLACCGAIFVVDPITFKWDFVEIGRDIGGFFSAYKYKDTVFLSDISERSGYLYRWDTVTGNLKKISVPVDGDSFYVIRGKGNRIVAAVFEGSSLWDFDISGDKAYSLDNKTAEDNTKLTIDGFKVMEDGVVILNDANAKWCTYESKKTAVVYHISDKNYLELFERSYYEKNKMGVLQEKYIALEDYIGLLTYDN